MEEKLQWGWEGATIFCLWHSVSLLPPEGAWFIGRPDLIQLCVSLCFSCGFCKQPIVGFYFLIQLDKIFCSFIGALNPFTCNKISNIWLWMYYYFLLMFVCPTCSGDFPLFFCLLLYWQCCGFCLFLYIPFFPLLDSMFKELKGKHPSLQSYSGDFGMPFPKVDRIIN